MDIHDLKIFLMIAQACSVSGNTYRNGCKRYAQERLHDKKKLISSNEKLRVSHKLYRMHEKAEYSLCLFVYNSMEIDDDYNNGIFIEKLNLNKMYKRI